MQHFQKEDMEMDATNQPELNSHLHHSTEDAEMVDAVTTTETEDQREPDEPNSDEAIESDLESSDSIYGPAPPSDSRQYSRWSQLVHLRHSRDRSRPFPEESTDEEWRANLCPVEDEADEVNYETSDESGYDRRWVRQANQLMVATDTRIQSASTESLFPGARIGFRFEGGQILVDPEVPENELDADKDDHIFREVFERMVHLDAPTRDLISELLEHFEEHDWDHPFDQVSVDEFKNMIDEHVEPTNPEVTQIVKLLKQLNEALKSSESAMAAYLSNGGIEFNEIGPFVLEQQRIKEEITRQTERRTSLETPLWKSCMTYLEEVRADELTDPWEVGNSGYGGCRRYIPPEDETKVDEEAPKKKEVVKPSKDEVEIEELLEELDSDREGRLDWMFEQSTAEYESMHVHLAWSEVMLFLKQDSFMGSSSNRLIQELFSQPDFAIKPESPVKDWNGWVILRSEELDETQREDRAKLHALDLLVDLVTEIVDDRLELYEQLRDENDLIRTSFEQLHKAGSLVLGRYQIDQSNDQDRLEQVGEAMDDGHEVMVDDSEETKQQQPEQAEEVDADVEVDGGATTSSSVSTMSPSDMAALMAQLSSELIALQSYTETLDSYVKQDQSQQPSSTTSETVAPTVPVGGDSLMDTNTQSATPLSPFEQLSRFLSESKFQLKRAYERFNHLLLPMPEYHQFWSDLLDSCGTQLERLKTDTIIPRPILEAIAYETTLEYSNSKDWSSEAIAALHHAAESFLVDHFDSNRRRMDEFNRLNQTETVDPMIQPKPVVVCSKTPILKIKKKP